LQNSIWLNLRERSHQERKRHNGLVFRVGHGFAGRDNKPVGLEEVNEHEAGAMSSSGDDALEMTQVATIHDLLL
jgi:hypothetical protein